MLHQTTRECKSFPSFIEKNARSHEKHPIDVPKAIPRRMQAVLAVSTVCLPQHHFSKVLKGVSLGFFLQPQKIEKAAGDLPFSETFGHTGRASFLVIDRMHGARRVGAGTKSAQLFHRFFFSCCQIGSSSVLGCFPIITLSGRFVISPSPGRVAKLAGL